MEIAAVLNIGAVTHERLLTGSKFAKMTYDSGRVITITARQKLIRITDRSEFGWTTVSKYSRTVAPPTNYVCVMHVACACA